jgi:hypothetical protein
VDARKVRYGAADLARLFGRRGRLVAAKGGKVLEFDLEHAAFETGALEAAVIGPSGNLRAPALRVGQHWLVGFDAGTWSAALG